ncbi:hypothetical protein [Lactovum odontotermitis]
MTRVERIEDLSSDEKRHYLEEVLRIKVSELTSEEAEKTYQFLGDFHQRLGRLPTSEEYQMNQTADFSQMYAKARNLDFQTKGEFSKLNYGESANEVTEEKEKPAIYQPEKNRKSGYYKIAALVIVVVLIAMGIYLPLQHSTKNISESSTSSSEKTLESSSTQTSSSSSGSESSPEKDGETSSSAPSPALTVNQMAEEIIQKGNWGNGQERIDRLTAAGYDSSMVQARINEILK